MSRLIDADALEEGKFHSIENWTPIESASWQRGWNDAIDAIIDNALTVDAVKHGHWIKDILTSTSGGSYATNRCSRCGWAYPTLETPYCPCCGAKMDEVEDE